MIEAKLRNILSRLGISVVSKSSEGWLRAHCCFAPWLHAQGTDKRPAFAAFVCDDGESYYKCLACKMGGRISSLVRSLEYYRQTQYQGLSLEADIADAEGIINMSYEDAIAHRLQQAEDQAQPIAEAVVQGMYEPAWGLKYPRQYLERRGVSQEAAELLGLVYDPDERRVLFPVRDRQGLLYGYSGRSVLRDEDFSRMYKGYPKIRDYLGLQKRHFLLGENLWQPGKPAFVIEGLLGLACLISNGARDIANPLALMGSEMTSLKANRLEMLHGAVYLMMDDDPAGDACLWGPWDSKANDYRGNGAYDKLTKRGIPVFIPEYPAGLDDIDGLSKEDLQTILDNCPPYVPP